MKRLFTFLLCLVMVFSLIPAAAAAEGIESTDAVETGDSSAADEELIDIAEPAMAPDALPADAAADDGGDSVQIARSAAVPDALSADAITGDDGEDNVRSVEPAAVSETLSTDKVASGKCGDSVQWSLDSDGLFRLTGTGDMWDFGNSKPVPWKDYVNSIKSLYIAPDITSIGDNAFFGCRNLKLNPESSHCLGYVDYIGFAAFYGCTSLDYVYIPRSVTSVRQDAFFGCTNLKYVTIAGHPAVQFSAFSDCTSMEALSLLSNLAPSFAGDTFAGTPRITVFYPAHNSNYSSCVGENYGGNLNWSEGLHGWCGDNLEWDLDSDGRLSIYGTGQTWALPSFRERMGEITSAYVGPNVTDLGDYFFYTLSNMTEVTLPDGITKIGNYCFYGDPIASIDVPAEVTNIGDYAFGDTSLTDIRFLGHAPVISASAFSGLSNATARYYPLHDWTEDVWDRVGGGIDWVCDNKLGANVTWKLSSTGKLTLSGSGWTWDYAGSDHPGFWHVSDDCKSLSVESGVTELGESLFYGLDQLKTASLPKTLNKICSDAFGNCVELERISFYGSAPSFGSTCFYNVRDLTVRYPSSDTSWTDSVRKNYGADNVKWVAVAKPSITTNPTSTTAAKDSTVSFTVKASGVGLSYQWYYRTSSTGEWKKSTLTGNKTATVKVKATAARDGFQYCCRVSNVGGYKYSKAATLTVASKPVITTQPVSKTAAADTTVKFTVAATGATSYQWQYRKSASGTWYNSTQSGNKTATLTVTATEARNGFQYRCKVTNAAGTTNSSYAKLTVVTKPVVKTQPTSKTVTAGTTVKFKVVAAGGELSYQWQYRKGSSGTWYNCTSTGAKTAEMTLTGTAARNGFQFRCKITNLAGTTYTKTVTLTVQ